MNLVVMVWTGLTAYIILIIIELGVFRTMKLFLSKYITWPHRNNDVDTEPFDDDVLAEKLRVDQLSESELQSQALVIQNVSKYFNGFHAVKNVSVAIKR